MSSLTKAIEILKNVASRCAGVRALRNAARSITSRSITSRDIKTAVACLFIGAMVFLQGVGFQTATPTAGDSGEKGENGEPAAIVALIDDNRISMAMPLSSAEAVLESVKDSRDDAIAETDRSLQDGDLPAQTDAAGFEAGFAAGFEAGFAAGSAAGSSASGPSGSDFSGSAGEDAESGNLDEPLPPYLVYVSKNSFTIAILGLDEDGEYTRLVCTFPTAVGRTNGQTRAGTYTITGTTRWKIWSDDSFSPYATMHSGGLWFHGPIFAARDSTSLKAQSYNEIGTNATSGCMRTTTEAAHWIYSNIEVGTTVIIANDSKYKSTPVTKIGAGQRYDPTDPHIVYREFLSESSEIGIDKKGDSETVQWLTEMTASSG